MEEKNKIEIQKLTKQNLKEAWAFLLKHEKTSIALFSHLIENNKACLPKTAFSYYLLYKKDDSNISKKNKALLGIFMLSKSGLLFHQIADNLAFFQNADLLEIESVLKNANLYSIIGTKTGTELFQNIIAKSTGKKPQCEYTYHYLLYSERQKKMLDKKQEGRRIFPSEFHNFLKWNTIEDLDALAPLQAIYDQQEVIPPFKNFDPVLSKANLKRLLLTHKILSLYKDGDFIAKAGSNAIGLNWVQIGGVCTKTNERNRGYAQFLVQNLIRCFREKEKKEVALFVKEDNESAKKAYQNLGFVFDSYFKIVYY